jgi:hypothetical protein
MTRQTVNRNRAPGAECRASGDEIERPREIRDGGFQVFIINAQLVPGPPRCVMPKVPFPLAPALSPSDGERAGVRGRPFVVHPTDPSVLGGILNQPCGLRVLPEFLLTPSRDGGILVPVSGRSLKRACQTQPQRLLRRREASFGPPIGAQ